MYDLVIRDATTISAEGRWVVDVAIKAGKIVYVGPSPRRKGTREINAMGRFLIPGLIDTAVQFNAHQSGSKWDIETGAAVTGGVTTVLALPYQSNPVIDAKSAKQHIDSASKKSWCHYGLWGSAVFDNARELEICYQQGLIQGILMVVDDKEHAERLTHHTASSLAKYQGIIGLKLNTPTEEQGLRDFVNAVTTTEKKVHLLNLTRSEELSVLDPVKGSVPATAAVTPHHLFLSENETFETPLPVCAEQDRRSLWAAVQKGRLHCIASDHHIEAHDGFPYVPGTELLFSLMMSAVHAGRISLEQFVSLCCTAPSEIFGLHGKGKIEPGFDADLVLFSEGGVNRVQPEMLLSSAGWSPYQYKEMAPKPDMVLVSGAIVAEQGTLTGTAPNGRWVGTTSDS